MADASRQPCGRDLPAAHAVSVQPSQSRTPFLVRRDEQRSVLRAVRVPSRLVLACACCWESSKDRHGLGSRRRIPASRSSSRGPAGRSNASNRPLNPLGTDLGGPNPTTLSLPACDSVHRRRASATIDAVCCGISTNRSKEKQDRAGPVAWHTVDLAPKDQVRSSVFSTFPCCAASTRRTARKKSGLRESPTLVSLLHRYVVLGPGRRR